MRIYIQQIRGFLNPQLEISLTIIFDNHMWEKGARLSEDDLKLLNYILGIKYGALPDRIELSTVKKRVLKILKSTSPAYKLRFANEALWYDRGSLTVRLNYDHNFPKLLMRIYAFMKEKGLSFERPDETPPTRKKPLSLLRSGLSNNLRLRAEVLNSTLVCKYAYTSNDASVQQDF